MKEQKNENLNRKYVSIFEKSDINIISDTPQRYCSLLNEKDDNE